MARKRSQLNINIDPELLLKLKSQAIKEGKTLTDFVTDLLKAVPSEEPNELLETRLAKVESILGDHLWNLKSVSPNPGKEKQIGSIFSDEGAKAYAEVARLEFEAHMKKKKLTLQQALQEVSFHLKKHPYSNPELVYQILMGTHVLTGLEMTKAYRHGSCAMRSALNDWTQNPLERLNEAFLNAVISKSLA